jgi:hypothetical protein
MPDIEILCSHCGKHSTDPDFCSECGKPIGPQTASAADPADSVQQHLVNAGGVELCPDCGEPRPGPHARYCDNCRYDFQMHKSFAVAPAAAPPAPAPFPVAPLQVITDTTVPASSATAVPPAAFNAGTFRSWEIVAVVDASLRQSDSPDAPVGVPERLFPLIEENLIGRRSQQQGIFPMIGLDGDSGVSRRHAQIMRAADGALSLLDLGSSNGTRLNGHEIQANVPVPLDAGDVITLGHWSRLTLRAH